MPRLDVRLHPTTYFAAGPQRLLFALFLRLLNQTRQEAGLAAIAESEIMALFRTLLREET